MHKVCIIAGNAQYRMMFHKAGWKIVTSLAEADLVQFTGGEDVHSSFYGEPSHPHTYSNIERDNYEKQIFDKCCELGIPMAGICRGGQFLNVMCGGKLFQHVTNHGIHGVHEALDRPTGNIRYVTSTHHQMMRVGPLAELVAIATLASSRQYVADDGQVMEDDLASPDVEVVFYPDKNVLCFQPHPEFPGHEDCTSYYFELLNRYLGF